MVYDGAHRLKPITIIIGANSTGKTAIMSLPLLLKQTAMTSENRLRGPLKLHGQEVSFEQAQQLYFNGDLSSKLEIGIAFDSQRMLANIHREIDEFATYLGD